MARRTSRPAEGFAPAQAGSLVDQWASGREVYVDNLKVLLIAAIIAIHGLLGYVGAFNVWSYAGVQEVTLGPLTEAVLVVLVGPFGLFMIPLFFLVAGLLTGPSVARKGPGRFALDRLLRLGVPFALYVLLVQPTLMYALYHPLGVVTGSYWEEYVGTDGKLDTGPLWFVGVLLIFSLTYAAWVSLRRRRPARSGPRPTTMRRLLLMTAVVTGASFAVRLVYPYGSEAGFTDLNFWEWPACIAVFGLGIAASRQGWLAAVPDRLRRQCRATTLLFLLAMAGFLLLVGGAGTAEEAMGGRHWSALVFAAIEGTLCVFGSVWLLSVAQRHLDRPFRRGPALSRSAYGAFMVQGLVLIGLALALRPLPLPAEVKAVVVASGGVAGSFALAWLLITRVPGVARIL